MEFSTPTAMNSDYSWACSHCYGTYSCKTEMTEALKQFLPELKLLMEETLTGKSNKHITGGQDLEDRLRILEKISSGWEERMLIWDEKISCLEKTILRGEESLEKVKQSVAAQQSYMHGIGQKVHELEAVSCEDTSEGDMNED